MKKYKTLSFLLFYIVFVEIGLVFGITPEEVIESYAKGSLYNGNVLAYYNKNGEIVVLKNGGYVKKTRKEVLDPTLAEIIACCTGKLCQECCSFYCNGSREYMSAKEIKMQDVQEFLELILKESNHFSEHIINETARSITRYLEVAKEMPKERIKNSSLLDLRWVHIFKDYGKSIDETPFPRNNKFSEALAEYCKANNSNQDGWEVNLRPLGNFKHTEVQIEVLYRAYRDCQDGEIKRFLESLLPVTLIDPDRHDIDHNIYSLYEACNVCRQANWLQDKKEFFKFKVVDKQVEKKEEGYFVLYEMATQAKLEVWQEQHKEEQASITSFARGYFKAKTKRVSKPESGFKDCESNKNKIENNYTRELAPSL